MDPESSDICVAGLIDHYIQRPDVLENTCLAKFAAFYNFQKTRKGAKISNASDDEMILSNDENTSNDSNVLELKNKLGFLKLRRKPKIIRYRKYNKSNDPDNFFRELIMLYYPWRNEEEELININAKYIFDENQEIIIENRKCFVYNLENDTEIHDAVEMREKTLIQEYEMNEKMDAVDAEFIAYDCASTTHQFDITTELGEVAPSNYVDALIAPQEIPESDYLELIRKLNLRQKDFLMHVMNEVKSSGRVLRHFVSGSAGTGKTLLIKALYQSLSKYFNKRRGSNPSDIKILLCAPTGKAAFNIEGMTLHSAFALPINQCGQQTSELSAEISNTLCTKYCKLKAVIIDEVSMMGSQMLNNVNRRLRNIFRNEDDFGGISIFLFGDMRQLPPVGDSFIFLPSRSDVLGRIIGPPSILWENFILYELTEIMRQKEDISFANALCNLADGTMTEDDINLLSSRTFEENTLPEGLSNCLRLFATNNEKDHYNDVVLNRMNTEGILAEAFDCCLGHGSEKTKQNMMEIVGKKKTTETYGLPKSVLLKVDARYMITNNIDVEDGLVNGSTGVLKKIQYGKLEKCENLIPIRLWIEFDSKRVGVKARSTLEFYRKSNDISILWTPVELMTRQIHSRKSSNIHVIRRQFPVTAAEAITIHKSQGSTYEKVVVHLSKRMTRQALYVACSRTTKASGLYLIGKFLPPSPPSKDDIVLKEMKRLRENPLIPKFQSIRKPNQELQVMFHNIQSLKKHLPDIISDASYMSSDILLLAETWLLESDEVDIPGFKEIARVDCHVRRKPQGVAAFIKNDLFSKIANIKKVDNISTPRAPHSEAVQFEVFNTIYTVLYISPKSTMKDVFRVVQNLTQSKGYQVLTGDFNIDFNNEQGGKLKSFLLERGLKKIGPENTSTTDNNTHIDGIFSNISCTCDTYESLFSYHKPLWCRITHPS